VAVEPQAPSPTRAAEHKWFISVITMRHCGACELLKCDFASAESLAAFVNVKDRAQSWSHYGAYYWDDPTQNWRWKNICLTTFPTIIIQPPRSGEYGDPRTVVWQKVGYDGNDRQLAKDIRRAILAYVAKLPSGLASKPPFGPANPSQLKDPPDRQVLLPAETGQEVGR
jgi:hypothetical protein